jgi:hypothetical protein
MSKENRQGLLRLVPQLLQKLREGLEDISYSPFETTQLFKQLETLHLTRLRSVPKIDEAPAPIASKIQVKLADIAAPNIAVTRVQVAEVPVLNSVPKVEVVDTKLAAAEVANAASDTVAQVNADIDAPLPKLQESAPSILVDNPVAQASVISEIIPAVEPLVPVGASLESLETLVVVKEEPEVAPAAESLPEGDQHLALVGNITQGSWFEMQTEDGQKFRSRLAAIIRATGKYIFVNRSGVKVAEETRMTLAMALKSGRMQVLDDGMLFDRALEAVIGNLRNSR